MIAERSPFANIEGEVRRTRRLLAGSRAGRCSRGAVWRSPQPPGREPRTDGMLAHRDTSRLISGTSYPMPSLSPAGAPPRRATAPRGLFVAIQSPRPALCAPRPSRARLPHHTARTWARNSMAFCAVPLPANISCTGVVQLHRHGTFDTAPSYRLTKRQTRSRRSPSVRRESQSVEGRAGRTRHRPPAWAIAAHRHAPPARLEPRPRCCRAQVRARRAEITSVRVRAVRARVAAVARPRGRTTLIRQWVPGTR